MLAPEGLLDNAGSTFMTNALGSPKTATLMIEDNDQVTTLQFAQATYSASENQGTVIITVSQLGGEDGAVSVEYTTANSTARAERLRRG